MAADLDEFDHLANRLREITEAFRERNLASTAGKDRIFELRHEAECTAARMSELLTRWIEKEGKDGSER
jgi:hypothetical protein